jgi:hypothetical protein
LAQLAGLISGAGLVHLARGAEVSGAEQQAEETDDAERQLRQQLTSAWASMSAMAFQDAERQFETALQLDPSQFLPLTGLYQLRKLKPDAEIFHETARRVLSADISDEGLLKQQLTIYRDYCKRIADTNELALDIRVKMIAHLSRIGESKEADKLASDIEKQGERHPLLARSLVLLSQALQNTNQGRSNHLRMLAARLTEEATA